MAEEVVITYQNLYVVQKSWWRNKNTNKNQPKVQTGALWQVEGWDGKGGPGGRGHWCTYAWFLLMYDRKPQNSIKQLSVNKKNFF